MSKWISTADELPVQTRSNRGVPVIAAIYARTVISAVYDEGAFLMEGCQMEDVTHWMPMPVAPNGGQI